MGEIGRERTGKQGGGVGRGAEHVRMTGTGVMAGIDRLVLYGMEDSLY